jgi:hypothetical protein
MMSVRATERLLGDVVTVTELSNSPKMVVQTVDIDRKLVTTVWFSNANEAQSAVFPASALDRVEFNAAPVKKAAAPAKAVPAKKPGKKK